MIYDTRSFHYEVRLILEDLRDVFITVERGILESELFFSIWYDFSKGDIYLSDNFHFGFTVDINKDLVEELDKLKRTYKYGTSKEDKRRKELKIMKDKVFDGLKVLNISKVLEMLNHKELWDKIIKAELKRERGY